MIRAHTTRSSSRRQNGGNLAGYLLYAPPMAQPSISKKQRVEDSRPERVRGEPYTIRDGSRGSDSNGDAWFFDMVSVSRCDVVPIRLLRMEDLKEGDDRECPISMAEFDKATVDCVEDGVKLFPGALEDRCIAAMPCGHMFGLMPLVYHALLGSMRCPICRQGVEKRMRPSCVPDPIRSIFKEKAEKCKAEELADIEARSEYAVRMMVSSRGWQSGTGIMRFFSDVTDHEEEISVHVQAWFSRQRSSSQSAAEEEEAAEEGGRREDNAETIVID